MHCSFVPFLIFLSLTHVQTVPVDKSNLIPYGAAPKYKVIQFLTEQLLSLEEKVKDIPVSESLLYHHIFDGADICERDLTLVSKDSGDGQINGVNMVMKQDNISKMYGAGSLNSVLDFVLSCYNWAKPNHYDSEEGYVSILRAFTNKDINKHLLKSTLAKLKAMSLLRGQPLYHILWETKSDHLSKYLKQLGYKEVVCGRAQSSCDWSKVGMPKAVADNQCLYQITIRT